MEKTELIDDLRNILHEDYSLEPDQLHTEAIAETLKRFFSVLESVDRQVRTSGDENNEK